MPTASEIDVNALMRGLVHELRNPLSAIITASSLLLPAENMDEEGVMLLDVVQKEARRMNRILTEFSSFVKPPAPHPEAFDLARLVREIIRELQSEKLLNAAIAIDDALPAALWAHGDMMQVRQALRHIVANAAEAMEEGGLLQFTSAIEGGQTWICIEDSGVGVENIDLELVFQPFFSTKPASTGLGLSIARSLLRASGGDLMLENPQEQKSAPDREPNRESASKPCQGARVSLHLPHPEPAPLANNPAR